jgi:predicted transcriptional regulator YheO
MSHPEESNEHLESPLTDVTVVIEGTYRGQVMEIVSKFYYQLMHEGNDLRSIKIYIKNAPTCFGVITIIRSTLCDLAKVTFVKTVS